MVFVFSVRVLVRALPSYIQKIGIDTLAFMPSGKLWFFTSPSLPSFLIRIG